MKIAIIGGTGPEGSGLGFRWAAAGHEVIIGSRRAEKGQQVAAELLALEPDFPIRGMDNLAAVTACEVVDACVGEIVEAVLGRGGSAIVTADHGNAEMMRDPATGSPHTAHTVFDVPVIVVGEGVRGAKLVERADADHAGDARLADLVPTMFQLMGLEQPDAMTGRSLIR